MKSTGMSIPMPIVDSIIMYMKPIEYKNINSKYRNIAITTSKAIIRKYVKNWCYLYSEKMNETTYAIPRIYYKMFYPIKFRSGFIDEVFDLLSVDMQRYMIVSNILENSEGIVKDFNKVIDILSSDELFQLGW